MAEHHPTLSPSALPMLDACPCFERAEDAAAMALEPRELSPDYKDKGTMMHHVYESQLRGKTTVLEAGLSPHELEGIGWAVDYTKMHLKVDRPVEQEQQLVLTDDDFNVVTFGTGDVLNGPQIFDLKTGELHNYYLQMATYGLMQMDRIGEDSCLIHLLFTRFKKAIELLVERETAKQRVFKVVAAVLDPDRKPKANPYCKWCRKVMTCEAVVKLVDGEQCDNYAIVVPQLLAEALDRAKVLSEWVDRLLAHAKNLAMAGTEIPGYELKSRAGAREIMDVAKAHQLSGLPAEQFLQLCKISVGAVEDAIATRDGIPKSQAKKLVNTQLGEVIKRRPPTVQLAPTKSQEPTEK